MARARSSLAVSQTFSRLRARHASVTLGSQTGRTLGVWLLRGPRHGSADVYVGTRRVGRLSSSATRTSRALVKIPVARGFSGTVRIVSTSSRPTDVDALGVTR